MHIPLLISLVLSNLTQLITNFNEPSIPVLKCLPYVAEFEPRNITNCIMVSHTLGVSLFKTELDWRPNSNCEIPDLVEQEQCNSIPVGNQRLMMRYIQQQPLIATIQTHEPIFKIYKSGVITAEECGQDVNYRNHVVMIIGYGVENNTTYWLVKNLRGTKEWEYVKIARTDSSMDLGVCGIAGLVWF